MHIPIQIKSERQRRRALRTLLEVEGLHVAQCECPNSCDMLRRLREDIIEVKSQLNRRQSQAANCRDFSRRGQP